MAGLNDIQAEFAIGPHEIREKYLRKILKLCGTALDLDPAKTGVIAYYSGWLQKGGGAGVAIEDADTNAFMATVQKLPKEHLLLLLHTPGGLITATEFLVTYLRSKFEQITVIVPQLAMSAGTMISIASQQIVMGKHSALGPIDPQFGAMPAQGLLDEYEFAKQQIASNPSSAPIWAAIFSKVSPTSINSCKQAVELTNELANKWLGEHMSDKSRVDDAVKKLSDHTGSKVHSRHFDVEACVAMGLNVRRLEQNQQFQDAVLSYHHAAMLTFAKTNICKVVENNLGVRLATGLTTK